MEGLKEVIQAAGAAIRAKVQEVFDPAPTPSSGPNATETNSTDRQETRSTREITQLLSSFDDFGESEKDFREIENNHLKLDKTFQQVDGTDLTAVAVVITSACFLVSAHAAEHACFAKVLASNVTGTSLLGRDALNFFSKLACFSAIVNTTGSSQQSLAVQVMASQTVMLSLGSVLVTSPEQSKLSPHLLKPTVGGLVGFIVGAAVGGGVAVGAPVVGAPVVGAPVVGAFPELELDIGAFPELELEGAGAGVSLGTVSMNVSIVGAAVGAAVCAVKLAFPVEFPLVVSFPR